jgi:hypothetical protein
MYLSMKQRVLPKLDADGRARVLLFASPSVYYKFIAVNEEDTRFINELLCSDASRQPSIATGVPFSFAADRGSHFTYAFEQAGSPSSSSSSLESSSSSSTSSAVSSSSSSSSSSTTKTRAAALYRKFFPRSKCRSYDQRRPYMEVYNLYADAVISDDICVETNHFYEDYSLAVITRRALSTGDRIASMY